MSDSDSENELSDYGDSESETEQEEQEDHYIPLLIEKYRLIMSFINCTGRADTFEVNVAVLNKKMAETMYNESIINEETLTVINDLSEQLNAFEASIKNFLESNSRMFRFRLDVVRALFTAQELSHLETTRQKLEQLTELETQQPEETITLADLEKSWNTLTPEEKNELQILTGLQHPDKRDFGSVQDYQSVKSSLERLTGLVYPDKRQFRSMYQFESARREYLDSLNMLEEFYDDASAKNTLQTLTGVKYPNQDKYADFEQFKLAIINYYIRIYKFLYTYWDKYELAKYGFFTDISIFIDQYWEPFAINERKELVKIAESMGLKAPNSKSPEYIPFLKSLTKYLDEGYVYKTGVRKIGGVYEKIENPSVKKLLHELFATHGYVYKKGATKLRAGKQMVYNPSMKRRFQELRKEQYKRVVELDDHENEFMERYNKLLDLYKSLLLKLDKEHLIECIFTAKNFRRKSIVIDPSEKMSQMDYVLKERTPRNVSQRPSNVKTTSQLQAFLESENVVLKKLQQSDQFPGFLQSYDNFTKPRNLSQQESQNWYKTFKQIESQRNQIIQSNYITKLQELVQIKNGEILELQRQKKISESKLQQNFEKLSTQPEGLSQADSKQWDKLVEQIKLQSETPKQIKQIIAETEARQDIPPQQRETILRKKRQQLAAILSGNLKQNAVIRQGYIRKLSEIYKSYNSNVIEAVQRDISQILGEIANLKKSIDVARISVKPVISNVMTGPQNPNARYIGTEFTLTTEIATELINAVKRKLVNPRLLYYLELYDMNELTNGSRMMYNKREQRVISPDVYSRVKQFLLTRLKTIETDFENINREAFQQSISEISNVTGKTISGNQLTTLITRWNGEILRDVYGNNVFETLLFATNPLQFYSQQSIRDYNQLVKESTPPRQQEYTRAQAMHDGKWYTVQYLHKNPVTGQPTLMYKSELELDPRTQRRNVVNKETVRNGTTPYIKIELRTAQEGKSREIWKEVNTGEIKKIKVVK